MNWLEIALIGAVLAGATAGTVLVVRSPSFWVGLGAAMFNAAFPAIVQAVAKRMTPEQEAAFHDCVRRGGEWDHIRKKCRK